MPCNVKPLCNFTIQISINIDCVNFKIITQFKYCSFYTNKYLNQKKALQILKNISKGYFVIYM